MQRLFRKLALPTLPLLLALLLTASAALAHGGRPLGDYRLVIGWLEEPAYEGLKNGVDLRVTKLVASAPSQDEEQPHSHNENGHAHDDGESPSHSDSGESNGHAHDEEGGDGHSHDENGDAHGGDADGAAHHPGDGPIEAAAPMTVSIKAELDPLSGVNVQIVPSGFAFAPQQVNQPHRAGEGHAHIYVDGVKVNRVYTPWVHLDALAPGAHEIRVELNANPHNPYTYGGVPVAAVAPIVIPPPGAQTHTHTAESAAAPRPMSVRLDWQPDPLGGANLQIAAQGFAFAPHNAGAAHTPGEGHAHIYVNGVKVGRLYGPSFYLGKLAAGDNEVRVTLNANSHEPYTWNGAPVEATAAITIPAPQGGPGYGASSGHSDSDGHNHDTDGAGHNGDGHNHDADGAGHHNGDGDGHDGDGNGDHSGDADSHDGDGHSHDGDGDDHHNGDADSHDGDGDGHSHDGDGGHSSLLPGGMKTLARPLASGHAVEVAVEGLESTLQVEVTHQASGSSRIFDLRAVPEQPGDYAADLIPTAPGVYEFRVFGTIEGLAVDETFVSRGGGGDFDDIVSSAELQFPETLPETRELESAVRGALNTAQDAALAAGESSAPSALSIVAIIIGAAGILAGGGAMLLSNRRRPA